MALRLNKRKIRGSILPQFRFKGIPSFDFDPDLVTFTPYMAKRLGTVFAAAPIVQGKWDGSGEPGLLTFGRGAQVSGNWHDNFDAYQGSLVLRITPEWDGDDGVQHFFLGSSACIFLVKRTNGVLRFQLRSAGGSWPYADVDVSAWAAGSTHSIVARWDVNNKLDGTNYLCLSVDDIHAFGGSVLSGGARDPGIHISIGSELGPIDPANAIIEGLTLYRRVLFDGTRGIDAGNGDEIALISGASDRDPCLVTGSWDVVSCLPTDASVGQLVTGTGEAWSHPHASAETNLTDAFCQTTYGSSAWSTEGSPSAGPADQATATKIFAWGYDFTADAANEGIEQTKGSLTPGDDVALRVIAHCTTANAIRLLVYDEDGAANILQYDFGASSTRTAPGVAEVAFEVPAGCNNVSIHILSTANPQTIYVHQIEWQSDLWDDPGMETGTAPTDVGTPTSSAQDAGQAHSGTNSWKVVAAGDGDGIKRVITTTDGWFYHVSAWVYADTAGTVDMEGPTLQDGNTARVTTTTNDVWERLEFVFRASGGSADLQFTSNAAQTFYVDDVTVVGVGDVSLTCTPATKENSIETTGLRIDGRDRPAQLITHLEATKGRIRWKMTFRHDAADILKFVETTRAEVCILYGDTNNRIYLYVSSYHNMLLGITLPDSGATQIAWNFGGQIVAGVIYDMEIRYDSTKIWLMQDGVIRTTATPTGGINFELVPLTAFFGSSIWPCANQIDATFDKP